MHVHVSLNAYMFFYQTKKRPPRCRVRIQALAPNPGSPRVVGVAYNHFQKVLLWFQAT